VVNARSEEIASGDARESFDTVTGCGRRCEEGAILVLVAWKGKRDSDEELGRACELRADGDACCPPCRRRRGSYTVATESQSPGVGTGEDTGFLRTHGTDSITIGNDTGEVEMGWYEITSIGVAPDQPQARGPRLLLHAMLGHLRLGVDASADRPEQAKQEQGMRTTHLWPCQFSQGLFAIWPKMEPLGQSQGLDYPGAQCGRFSI